jgi:hypothetical protein
MLATFNQLSSSSYSAPTNMGGGGSATWSLVTTGVTGSSAVTTGGVYAPVSASNSYGVQVTSTASGAYLGIVSALMYNLSGATATPTPTPTATPTATTTATPTPTPFATPTPGQELDVRSLCLGGSCPGNGQAGNIYQGGHTFGLPGASGTLCASGSNCASYPSAIIGNCPLSPNTALVNNVDNIIVDCNVGVLPTSPHGTWLVITSGTVLVSFSSATAGLANLQLGFWIRDCPTNNTCSAASSPPNESTETDNTMNWTYNMAALCTGVGAPFTCCTGTGMGTCTASSELQLAIPAFAYVFADGSNPDVALHGTGGPHASLYNIDGGQGDAGGFGQGWHTSMNYIAIPQ